MRIRLPTLYGEVKKEIAKMWDIPHRVTNFPGPNPISLLPEHLPLLQPQNYLVTEKSDGVRYLFLLSRYPQGSKAYAAFIDRAWNIYQMEVFAVASMFDGTLFDGELVLDTKTKSLKFLVYDVIWFQGRDVKACPLAERHALINRSFPDIEEWNRNSHLSQASHLAREEKIILVRGQPNPIFAYAKKQMLLTNFGSLTRLRLHHASDGFIFTPRNAGVKDKDQPIFKYKFAPSIDTKYDGSNHFCMVEDEFVDLHKAFPECEFVFSLFPAMEEKEAIVESKIEEREPGKYECIFHKWRLDKTIANQQTTIAAILREVHEHITVKQLCTLLQSR